MVKELTMEKTVLPAGWEMKTLGEVCEINPKKSEVNNLPANHLVSFLPMKDLGVAQNQINPITIKQLSEVKGSYTYFRNNDILLAKVTPCFENGKLGIAYNLKNEIGFGSSEYIVFRPKNSILSEYLFYILTSTKFRNRGKKIMFGAVGLKRLSKDYVKNFVAPLPSLDQQKQIVATLDKAFAAIDTAKANAEQNLQNAKELFESYLQNIFDNEGPDWVTSTIGESCNLMTGGTPSRSKKEYFDNGAINWLVSGDINKKEINDCEGKITELGFENSNTKFLPLNSVMIALNGQGKTRGTVAMLRIKATCNQSLVSIYPKDDSSVLPELIYANLEGRYNEIRKITGDSGNDRRGLNMPLIRKISFSYPTSIDKQKVIIEQLTSLKSQTKKLEAIYSQKITDLEELKKSVLQKAFSGQLTSTN